MNILKVFSLGGIWENGKRFDSPLGTFQKCKNVFIDKSRRLIPIVFGSSVGTIAPPVNYGISNWVRIIKSIPFANNLFNISYSDDGTFKYFGFKLTNPETGLLVDDTDDYGDSETLYRKSMDASRYSGNGLPSNILSSAILYDKLFVSNGVDLSMYKLNNIKSFYPKNYSLIRHDGTKLRTAGLPTPWGHIQTTGTGAHYARQVYATLGFDGEPVFSAFRQTQLSGATVTVKLGGYSGSPMVPYSSPLGFGGVPAQLHIPDRIMPYDSLYQYDISSNTYSCSVDTNSSPSMEKFFNRSFIQIKTGTSIGLDSGDILMVRGQASPEFNSSNLGNGKWLLLYLEENFNHLPSGLIALKVKSHATVADGNIRFYATARVFSDITFNWEEFDLHSAISSMSFDEKLQLDGYFFNFPNYLTNIFNIISYSTSPTSGFEVKKILPVCWYSNLEVTGLNLSTVSLPSYKSNFMGVVSKYLIDWYDDTKSFAMFPFLQGVTEYRGLIVGHDSNAIYFSSPALGGSSEMIDGGTNFTVPSTEAGKITAICGSEEFLFVSRENKNFVIRGDIYGGNFSIIDCDYPTQGAINSNHCINSFNSEIVFVNKSGVYAVNANGSIRELSEKIRNMFTGDGLISTHDFNKNSLKNNYDYTQGFKYDASVFNISIDANRSLLIITSGLLFTQTTYSVEPSTLIYNFILDEWTEYKGSFRHNQINSVNGKFIATGDSQRVFDGSLAMNGADNQNLVSSWITVGEPSLEKQIGQMRLYGEGQGVNLSHNLHLDYNYRDSDPDSIPVNVSRYDSNKKLNTEKPCSFAIELNGKYKFDGYEIELEVIQNGIKKRYGK